MSSSIIKYEVERPEYTEAMSAVSSEERKDDSYDVCEGNIYVVSYNKLSNFENSNNNGEVGVEIGELQKP